MNYMSEVANLLGVELGERFNIDFHDEDDNKSFCDNVYYFCNSGITLDKAGHVCSSADMLALLLCGKYTIKGKEWKPKNGEEYWSIEASFGDAVCIRWSGRWVDIMYYKVGNCYRTKEEAEANRDKWVAFYASDEVLEV